MIPSSSPHDSAISVGTTPAEPSKTPPTELQAEASNPPRRSSNSPKSSSPRNSVAIPYSELSPEAQAAQDAETESAVTQAQEEIEIDSGADAASVSGSDAGYETDSVGSASTSLASSVRDYAFENGRRYHKFREGTYNFPNDDSEQDREDMKHAMMVNLLGGKLHFAPIGENPQNVLDMGTGTGIWAIESEFFASMLCTRLLEGVNAKYTWNPMTNCKHSGRLVSQRKHPRCRFKSHPANVGSTKRQVYGR